MWMKVSDAVVSVPQASPEQLSSKDSPSSRKSSGSPKHKSGAKGPGSGKKEKKVSVSSPVSESARYVGALRVWACCLVARTA